MIRRITCHCEHSFDIDIPDTYDLKPGSISRQQVLDGSFLTIACEKCGNSIRPEFALTFSTGAEEKDLFLIPEIERDRFLLGNYAVPEHTEVVIGFPELRERIRIGDDGYEKPAIELLKYHILSRAPKQQDVRIYYAETRMEELSFNIHGIKTDEVAVIRIPLSLYTRTLMESSTKKREEPLKTILEGPYISVHKIDIDSGAAHE